MIFNAYVIYYPSIHTLNTCCYYYYYSSSSRKSITNTIISKMPLSSRFNEPKTKRAKTAAEKRKQAAATAAADAELMDENNENIDNNKKTNGTKEVATAAVAVMEVTNDVAAKSNGNHIDNDSSMIQFMEIKKEKIYKSIYVYFKSGCCTFIRS